MITMVYLKKWNEVFLSRMYINRYEVSRQIDLTMQLQDF